MEESLVPSLCTQFEVLVETILSLDLEDLTENEIKLIKFLTLQAKEAVFVTKEELNAVETEFLSLASEKLEELMNEQPRQDKVIDCSKTQYETQTNWVQFEVEPPELPMEQAFEYRRHEILINEMDNVTELRTVALNLLEGLKLATRNEMMHRRIMADLMFPDIADMRKSA